MELKDKQLGGIVLGPLMGTGPIGRVYQSRDAARGVDVAVKVLKDDLSTDVGLKTRFETILQTTSRLRHPNIIRIEKFAVQNGSYYIISEYGVGGSLRYLTSRLNPMLLNVSVEIARQVAVALQHAHAAGVVHGGLKPDNVLLSRPTRGDVPRVDDLAKVSDFGMARMANGTFSDGSWAYMSPEQCLGVEIEGRSDLYSLGVVLYETCTGYPPFQSQNFEEACKKHLNDTPISPRQIRSDIPIALEDIILRCLAKKATDRYSSAEELAQNLANVMRILPDSPKKPKPPEPQPQPAPSPTPPEAGGPFIEIRDKTGELKQRIDISKLSKIRVGRGKGNNIQIERRDISTNHLLIEWDGQQATVMDLNSTNGTRLNGKPLTPQTRQKWIPGQDIQIGEFRLLLLLPNGWSNGEGRGSYIEPPLLTPAVPLPSKSVDQPPIPVNRLSVKIDKRAVTIAPGETALLTLELKNTGTNTDHWLVTTEGVPPQWVQRPLKEIELNPGASTSVSLTVSVPRTSASEAKVYEISIQLRLKADKQVMMTVSTRLTVTGFEDIELILEPECASGRRGAAYDVTVRNTGNQVARVTLKAKDGARTLAFQFFDNPVKVFPGSKQHVRLEITAPNRFIGVKEEHEFVVACQTNMSGSASEKEARARFSHTALFPPVVATVAMVCFGSLFGLIFWLVSLGRADLKEMIEDARRKVQTAQADVKAARDASEALRLLHPSNKAAQLQQQITASQGEITRLSQVTIPALEQRYDAANNAALAANPPDPRLTQAAQEALRKLNQANRNLEQKSEEIKNLNLQLPQVQEQDVGNNDKLAAATSKEKQARDTATESLKEADDRVNAVSKLAPREGHKMREELDRYERDFAKI